MSNVFSAVSDQFVHKTSGKEIRLTAFCSQGSSTHFTIARAHDSSTRAPTRTHTWSVFITKILVQKSDKLAIMQFIPVLVVGLYACFHVKIVGLYACSYVKLKVYI